MAVVTPSLEQVRELCARLWNPIGVPMANTISEDELGFRPLPAGEYDGYLLHLLTLLQRGVPDRDLRSYLETVEREYIGLSKPAGDKANFLAALRELTAGSGA
jgi:hypothetical protein